MTRSVEVGEVARLWELGTRVLAEVVSADPSALDELIESALAEIAKRLDVTSLRLIEQRTVDGRFILEHSYLGPGIPDLLEESILDQLPWFSDIIKDRQILRLDSFEDIPVEAEADRAFAKEVGLKSLLGLPLMSGKEFFGYLAFANHDRERVWTDEVVEQLQRLAGVILAALFRRRREQEVATSDARFHRLAESLPGMLYQIRVRPPYETVYVNEAVEAITGYSVAEFLHGVVSVFDLVLPTDRTAALRRAEAAIARDEPFEVEYRLQSRNGRIHWMHNVGRLVHRPEGGAVVEGIALDVTARHRSEEALRESEQRYRQLFETAGEALVVMDEDTFVDANSRASELFGVPSFQLIGRHPADFSPPTQPDGRESLPVAREYIQAAFAGETQQFEWRHQRADGNPFDALVTLNLVVLEERPLLFAVVRDITERKRAEEKLRESDARQVLVLQSLPMAFYRADTHGNFGGTWVSDQIEAISGFAPADFISETGLWAKQLHPEDRERALAAFEKLEDGAPLHVEYRWRRADGEYRWFLDQAVLVPRVRDRPAQIVGTWRDVTEDHQLQEALARQRDDLRSLSSRLSVAEERERRRLAEILHDGATQNLALALMQLRQLQEALPDPDLAGQVHGLHELITLTTRDLRSLTFDLSPPALYEYGLEQALIELCDRFRLQRELPCVFLSDDLCIPLADEVETLLFQCCRELLINADKHARATRVELRIARDEEHCVIIVEDDGVGFDGAAAGETLETDRGFGLFSIRERLRSFGGSMTIDSRCQGGTRVTLKTPLASEEGERTP